MVSVKRLAIFTTALAVALGAGAISLSAQAETVYPSDTFEPYLTFENLADYAVDGDTYAFAQNKDGEGIIEVYTREKDEIFGTLKTYPLDFEISALDIEDGKIYYADPQGAAYVLDGPETSYEFNFPARINHGAYTYDLSEGTLSAVHFPDLASTRFEGVYSKLKIYGQTVYAIKENVLYSIDGANETAVNTLFRYYDYNQTQFMEIGAAADKLKTHLLSFVKIETGAYLTQIDLTDLTGSYFKANGTQKTTKSLNALLLCTVDDAAIIAIKNEAYITSSSYLTNLNDEEISQLCTFEENCGYDDGATITGNRIYASPFVSIGTSAANGVTGFKVNVLRKIAGDILGYTVYEVQYSLGGAVLIGYVAEGFLTPTLKEDTAPEKFPGDDNPDYSEKNNVTTVVIVIVLVVLVLAALGYLTYIGTSEKRRNKKKTVEEPDGEEDEEE